MKKQEKLAKAQEKLAKAQEKLAKAQEKLATMHGGDGCLPDEIVRAGYTTKPYTRADGVKISAKVVKPSCVKDKGSKGKGHKLFEMNKKHLLRPFGYNLQLKGEDRRKAIRLAMRTLPPLEVLRHLVAVRTLQKHTEYHARLDKDVRYAQEIYGKL